MAGGPRIKPVVNIWRHDCDCELCDWHDMNIEVDYQAVCCVGFTSSVGNRGHARMDLCNHLRDEHGVKKHWDTIPVPEVDYCTECGGESVVAWRRYRNNPCPACDNRGWREL